MTDYTARTASEMRSAFPEKPEPIRDEPTLQSLLRILRYLMECSQTISTDLSALNFLFVCIPPLLYGNYTNELYPLNPADPGLQPDYTGANSSAERANRKTQFSYAKCNRKEWENINKALNDTFLELCPAEYTKEFREQRISNPNSFFRDVFQQFLDLYGEADEHDRKENKERMEAEWHPNDGIQKLINQINTGREYAHFANQAIGDPEAVDIALRVLMHCGLFAVEYADWQAQADKSWLNFKNFWKVKCRLKKKTVRAGQIGYGMSSLEGAAQEDEALRQYEDTVDQFSNAHLATQDAIKQLTTTNSNLSSNVASEIGQLRQHMNMMQQTFQLAMAGMGRTQQPAPQYQPPPQQYQQPPQATQYRPQGNPQGRGNAGRGGAGRGFGGRGRGRGAGRGGYGPPASNLQGNPGYTQNVQHQPNFVKRNENDNYCSTHGADVPDGHTSMNCTRPGPNHNIFATRYNCMGGSPKAAHKNILPSGGQLAPCVGYGQPRRAQQANTQQGYGPQWNAWL